MSIKALTISFAVVGGLFSSVSGVMAQDYSAPRQICRDAETCDMRQTINNRTTINNICNSEYGCRTPSVVYRKQWGSEETIHYDR